MYHSLLQEAKLYEFLQHIDAELAARTRACGCQVCAGRLDRADYPRKPRGALARLGVEYERRLSFCCAARDCRTRATPPSVRYLGRKVYLGVVVLLVSVMRHGPSPWSASRLRELFGVSAKTLARWRAFWQELFPASRFWLAAQGRFARPVAPAELPASLMARFAGDAMARVCAVLHFLAPITSGSTGHAG